MHEPDLYELLDRYVAALNSRNIGELSELVAEGLLHNGERMTREQWWQGPVGQHIAAVPDQAWNIEEVVATGDRLFVRYRDQGTPTAPWLGLAPNGGAISFREYVFYRVLDGRIVEVWSVFDGEAVRRQLSPDSGAQA